MTDELNKNMLIDSFAKGIKKKKQIGELEQNTKNLALKKIIRTNCL